MKTTDIEFFRIVNYIRLNFGINLMSKRTLIEKRLEEILLNNNFKNFDDFMNSVENDRSNKLNNILISALVTNHTYFMRDSLHFELLKQVIMPKLLKHEKSIRIWSAAASSGQEAYSIEMILKDYEEEIESFDIEVLGTDISEVMLKMAIAGEYTKEQMEAVPEKWRRKYFTKKINGDYKINNFIKNDVIFEKLNLLSEFQFKNKFNIIFLRNVLIYFDSGIVDEIVDKVANNLLIGGYLFIGSTETVDINTSKLEYIQPSIYKKL